MASNASEGELPDPETDVCLSLHADIENDEETAEILDDSTVAGSEDSELEAINARVREMEEEAEKLKEMQSQVEKQMNLGSPGLNSQLSFSLEDAVDADSRSIYVGNVDYGTTAEELEAHFHGCGAVSRVTILCDKFSGHPKGFAYIEFTDKDSVITALALHESVFRGRQILVQAKRTNHPGISTTNRFPRGMRARGRGFSAYYASSYGAYAPRPRGRGAYRGRRAWYSPY